MNLYSWRKDFNTILGQGEIMGIFNKSISKTNLEFETTGLNPVQVRLLKSLNALLIHLTSTKNEGEFFDESAEVLRICASLIQSANFVKTHSQKDKIDYAGQVLEYSLDVLQEYINQARLHQYDN
jgi:hypothetical protein